MTYGGTALNILSLNQNANVGGGVLFNFEMGIQCSVVVTSPIGSSGSSDGTSNPEFRMSGGSDGGNGGSRRRVVAMNKRYREGLAIFKRRCTDYEAIKRFIAELFGADVLGIKTAFARANKVDVCDIGCGDGTVTLGLTTEVLINTGAQIHLDVIEPIDDYVIQTRRKLSSIQCERLTTAFHRCGAEQYFGTQVHHNLIFSAHSIYFFSIETVSNVWHTLSDGSYFITMAMSRRSIMALLKDLFAPTPTITADDVIEFMRNNMAGASYEVSAVGKPSVLDFSGIILCTSRGELSEEAKNLLSLMIQRDIDGLTQDEYGMVRDIILGRLTDGRLVLDNTGVVFKKHASKWTLNQ